MEDSAILASTFFGVAYSTTVFLAVRYGLGQAESLRGTADDGRAATVLYASDLLYIVALTFSKLATLQLISALSPGRQHKRACLALAALTIFWGTAALFAIALRCDLSGPYMSLTAHQCPDLFTRWAAIETISSCIEGSICTITAVMIYGLQMPRKKKIKAMVAFTVRLPVIIPTTLRLYYLRSAFNSNDFIFGATSAIISAQCVIHYSVISASLTYLKPFLAAFDSNLGASTKLETVVATRSRDFKKNMTDSGGHRGGTREVVSRTYAEIERDHPRKNNSQDSDAPIILKTVSYRVEVEGAQAAN
ncbi:hypothetical protein LTR95_006080 [Oleoguttula sp. CCFEE 5521]